MTSSDLAAWRKWMGFSQRDAAAALGVSLPTYQRLERGAKWADGVPVEIDRRTALACSAIASGVDELAPWRVGAPQRAAARRSAPPAARPTTGPMTTGPRTARPRTARPRTAVSG